MFDAVTQAMDDIEKQQKLVSWAYTMQWATLLLPPAILASAVLLFTIRKRITNPGLRSHLHWQIMTCIIAALLIGAAILLFVIGMSGLHTDAPISVIAVFMCTGIMSLMLPWFIYRLVRGTLYFSRESAMTSLIF